MDVLSADGDIHTVKLVEATSLSDVYPVGYACAPPLMSNATTSSDAPSPIDAAFLMIFFSSFSPYITVTDIDAICEAPWLSVTVTVMLFPPGEPQVNVCDVQLAVTESPSGSPQETL